MIILNTPLRPFKRLKFDRGRQNTIVRVLSVVEPITPSAAELWYDAGGSLERVQQEFNKRASELTTSIARKLEDGGWRLRLQYALATLAQR